MRRQLHGCQPSQVHQPKPLDLLIEADPFRRSEGPLAASSQMLRDTTTNVPVDVSEGLAWIHLLYASFRPHLAAVALAFSLALHLHQVGRGTCTPKLLSMPSTQRSRWRGGRYAWWSG